MDMQMYDCTVRLGNTTTSEVFKPGVTAAEISVFRALHGLDSVVRISAKNRAQGNSKMERERLEYLYGKAKPGLIRELFGPDHLELPAKLSESVEQAAAEAVAETEAAEASRKAATEKEINERVEAEVEARMKVQAAEQAAKAVNGPPPRKTLSLSVADKTA